MLRKLIVWISCFIVDYIFFIYGSNTEQGQVFLHIHLGATILMFLCEKISLIIDDKIIDDYFEYEERLGEVTDAFWDIILVIVILFLSEIITKIHGDTDRYFIYELITLGFSMSIPKRAYEEDEVEEPESESKDNNGNNEE